MEKKAHLTVLGFPVRFEIWFWVSAAFIASRTNDLNRALLWIVLVTVSILVHELGHALAYRRFGAEASISMWGMGGLTHGCNAGHLTPQQRIFVSAAGSTLEMVTLGIPAWVLDQLWAPGGWAGLTLHWLFWINVVWALVNLAPVWPMDGGHIIDEILFLREGSSQRRTTNAISLVTAIPIAIYMWTLDMTWGAFLFGFFIVLNLRALGVFKKRSGVEWWPGEGDGGERVSRPKQRSSADKLSSGYTALRNDAGSFAKREAAKVLSSSRSRSARRDASEMLAWAALADRREVELHHLVDGLDRPSPLLRAVLLLEAGADQEGIVALADALMSDPSHAAVEQAIVHVSRSGHIGHVVDVLLERGVAGRGHAVRVHSVLEAAGHDESRDHIGRMI